MFEALDTYAMRYGFSPEDFMYMGDSEASYDGADFKLYHYKHDATRNYLHVDERGISAWHKGHPVPFVLAYEHAVSFDHKSSDSCVHDSDHIKCCKR